MDETIQIHERLRESFGSRGFLLLGVTGIDVAEDHTRFLHWLEAGNHGGMDFLVRNSEIRGDLNRLLPGTKSAVIFALPYAPADASEQDKALAQVEAPSGPRIAKYARLRDYHKVMWQEGDAAFTAAQSSPSSAGCVA